MKDTADHVSDMPPSNRPGGITVPGRLVVRRPRHGWIAGLLGRAVIAILGLIATAVTLAAVAGVTVVLWWAGDVRIPVVILIYWSVVLATGGFAVGRVSLVPGRLPHLPQGPGDITWPTGTGNVVTGVVWEHDNVGYLPEEPAEGTDRAR